MSDTDAADHLDGHRLHIRQYKTKIQNDFICVYMNRYGIGGVPAHSGSSLT